MKSAPTVMKKNDKREGITKKAYNAAVRNAKLKKKNGEKSSVTPIKGSDNLYVYCNGIIVKKTSEKAGKGELMYTPLKKDKQFVDYNVLMKRLERSVLATNLETRKTKLAFFFILFFLFF